MTKVTKPDDASGMQITFASDRFGREKYLKENFPRILQMMRDTREWQQMLKDGNSAKDEGLDD
jgi:hypothetical protein